MSLLDKPNALIFKSQHHVVTMQIAQYISLSITLIPIYISARLRSISIVLIFYMLFAEIVYIIKINKNIA